jgi:hypothetical protein
MEAICDMGLTRRCNEPREVLPTENRRFKFHKRGQPFIRLLNETLFLIAMRVSNPDCSPVRIQG